MSPDEAVADGPEPPSKRQKKSIPIYADALISLNRKISPPLHGERSPIETCSILLSNSRNDFSPKLHTTGCENIETGKNATFKSTPDFIDLTIEEPEYFDSPTSQIDPKSKRGKGKPEPASPRSDSAEILPSPFQLTSITDLPASENIDTVRIKDILGDVMVKEAWIFNYLVDLDWVMDQFDPDTRRIVDVKIVHGSWRKEDSNRIRLEEQSKRYPNTTVICAYMPEPFGTHHSKMIVLFRYDDFAQVIIHTSNMIAFDWTNMTQAAWRSPLLPLIRSHNESPWNTNTTGLSIGDTFKHDLLAYFAEYSNGRTGDLTRKLERYSFERVRAVFIGSVPGKFQVDGRGKGEMWGWMALKRIVGNIPLANCSLDQEDEGSPGRIVVQISSIATLGQSNNWLSPVLCRALSASRNDCVSPSVPKPKKPKISIIFPTAKEVRDSLNGYDSGKAIHIKIQSMAQQKQLNYLRPFLCHWDPFTLPLASDQSSSSLATQERLSGRSRAAPHIKTYIRFIDESCTKIAWAMLTSANLSTQAWGGCLGNPSGRLMGQGEGEVKICSYEAGVVIFPELFKDFEEEEVEIVPVFKKDMPDVNEADRRKIVGLRMAYDLPIKAYGEKDMPWCTTMNYEALDWMGRSWQGD